VLMRASSINFARDDTSHWGHGRPNAQVYFDVNQRE